MRIGPASKHLLHLVQPHLLDKLPRRVPPTLRDGHLEALLEIGGSKRLRKAVELDDGVALLGLLEPLVEVVVADP